MRIAIIDNNNINVSMFDRIISVDPYNKFFIEYNPTDKYFDRMEEISTFYKRICGYDGIKGVLGKFILNIFNERKEIDIETRISLLFDRNEEIVFYNFTPYPFLFLKQYYIVKDNYLSRKVYIKVLKELVNKIFSFYFDRTLLFMRDKYRRDKKYKNIIKVWVEVSLKIYKKIIMEEKNKTLLLLQPFNISKERQKKALKIVKKYGVDFCRNIYNLSMWEGVSLIEYLWHSLMKYANNPYVVLFRMEILFRKYIAEKEVKRILHFSPENVFTKEEFKPESILISYHLLRNNVSVYNTMHGTGLYNMHQIYSVFNVYGDFFKHFYKDRIIARYNYYTPFSSTSNRLFNVEEKRPRKNIGIIMQYINSKYSILYYEKMLKTIDRLLKMGYRVYVKNHPNIKDEYKIPPKDNLIIVNSSQELYENVDIVITGFSTMGYEAIINGKICLFLNDKSYNLTPIGFVCPEFVFKDEISLLGAIEDILDKNFNDYWEKERKCMEYIINTRRQKYDY